MSPEIVEQIFRQNISMGKGMGLMAMVNAVRALAARARETEENAGATCPGVLGVQVPEPTPRRCVNPSPC